MPRGRRSTTTATIEQQTMADSRLDDLNGYGPEVPDDGYAPELAQASLPGTPAPRKSIAPERIHLSATLKAIRFKASTQADPDPRAELVFVTDSITGASELAWHLSQSLGLAVSPQQPRFTPDDGDGDEAGEDEPESEPEEEQHE